jgi:diguanylate cyclase (GGDEF)-like protein/PAS domain S-box-containing protein
MTLLRVLLVEDSEDDAMLVREALESGGYELRVERVDTEAALRHALREGQQWDIVLSDYLLPGFDARGTLLVLRETGLDLPVIVLSGTVGEEVAVETLKLGADDYLLKQTLTRLVPAVERAIGARQTRVRQRELERLQTIILDNSPDLICSVNPQGYFLQVSAACEAVLGYVPDQLVGQYFGKFVHPDDRASVLEQFRAVLQGERLRDFECRLVGRAGQAVPLTWSVTLSAADNVIVGVGRDITARNRMVEALRQERDYVEAVLNSLPGIFYHYDANLRLLRWNRNHEWASGYSAEELSNVDPLERFPEEERALIRSRIAEVFEKGESQATYIMRDGRRVPYLFTGVRFEHEGRKGFLGVGIDISERKEKDDALRSERARLRSLIDSIPDLVFFKDQNFVFLGCNRSFENYLGISESDLIGKTDFELVGEDWARYYRNEDEKLFASGQVQHTEEQIPGSDGRTGIFDTIKAPFYGPDGKLLGLVGISRNITGRKQMEDALREKTALFESQVENSPDGILVVDRNGRKLIQNQRMIQMWRIPPELAGVADVAPEFEFATQQVQDPAAFTARVAWLYEHPEELGRDQIELVDGTIIDLYSAAVFDKQGQYYGRLWTHRDVTEVRQAERRLRHIATHDDLTGLSNRNLIQSRIARTIDRARRKGGQFALVYLDLDRFKVINDGYGHPFGDLVLQAASDLLRTLARSGDTVARYGGDEFLILMAELGGAEEAHAIARAIVENLNRPLVVQGREIFLTGSVGVSVFPQDGDTAEALIGNADIAMYRAKGLGRNTWRFFTREMSEETQRRIDLETRLRGAAAAGELELHYQPKVNLASGEITGCEALLRWRHPELGMIPPDRFIPLAEESGVIVQIGQWVLRTACAQARAWLDAGLAPGSVAVNLSARQFLQQDVVAWVTGTLREIGLSPGQLELELTETMIAQDLEKAVATVAQLRRLGVKLSIDDFGTGYSSLNYLRRFRVDSLKIDQSFVRNMLTEGEDATIVAAIISLAHNLKFKVIAEGVANAEQCRFLRAGHCDEIQGYHFSMPVPAAEFETMLRAGKRLQAD